MRGIAQREVGTGQAADREEGTGAQLTGKGVRLTVKGQEVC